MQKRVGLFVDVKNQYYAVRNKNAKVAIDYDKYLAEACKDNECYRAFAYGVQMNNEAAGFIARLKALGYEPRYRKAISSGGTSDIRKTDRNMDIAMDVWRCIDMLDIVIIGSSDPDLVPLVSRIKELGRQVIVYSCDISRELKDAADRHYEIDFASIGRERKAEEDNEPKAGDADRT